MTNFSIITADLQKNCKRGICLLVEVKERKKTVLRIRIRSRPVFFGSSGSGFQKPDPRIRIRIRKKMDRIRITGKTPDKIQAKNYQINV